MKSLEHVLKDSLLQRDQMAVELAKLSSILPLHNDGEHEKHNLETQENTFVRRSEEQIQTE